MRGFLVLVLAALLPLQLAVAAIVPACAAYGGAVQGARTAGSSAERPAAVCGGPMQPAPHHGAGRHHGCSHIALTFIGAAYAALFLAAVSHPAPVASPIAFDSVVLDVPLPPPTAPC